MNGRDLGLLLLAVTLLSVGCAPVGPDHGRPQRDDFANFHAAGRDVVVEVRGHRDANPAERSIPALTIDIDRCRVVGYADGVSRLDYPLTPPRPWHAPDPHATLWSTRMPDERTGGHLDLVEPGDESYDLYYPGQSGPHRWAEMMFIPRPLNELPRRLAAALGGPGAVAPAVVELARELADSPSVGFAGTLDGVGTFGGRLALTDAGRAKLRAALARRDAATRPAARR